MIDLPEGCAIHLPIFRPLNSSPTLKAVSGFAYSSNRLSVLVILCPIMDALTECRRAHGAGVNGSSCHHPAAFNCLTFATSLRSPAGSHTAAAFREAS
jgi:hypothetical protein